MHIKKICVTTLALLLTTPSFAMFCPNSFNTINVGDSLDSVQQLCGKPISEKDSESTSDAPQEWVYYTKSSPTDQATLRMTVAFVGGQVTNMSVNGIGLSNTQLCAGNTVQVGDTVKSVETACGKPAFINQGNPPQNNDVTKIAELTYNGNTGTVVLVFENGKLKGTK